MQYLGEILVEVLLGKARPLGERELAWAIESAQKAGTCRRLRFELPPALWFCFRPYRRVAIELTTLHRALRGLA